MFDEWLVVWRGEMLWATLFTGVNIIDYKGLIGKMFGLRRTGKILSNILYL